MYSICAFDYTTVYVTGNSVGQLNKADISISNWKKQISAKYKENQSNANMCEAKKEETVGRPHIEEVSETKVSLGHHTFHSSATKSLAPPVCSEEL